MQKCCSPLKIKLYMGLVRCLTINNINMLIQTRSIHYLKCDLKMVSLCNRIPVLMKPIYNTSTSYSSAKPVHLSWECKQMRPALNCRSRPNSVFNAKSTKSNVFTDYRPSNVASLQRKYKNFPLDCSCKDSKDGIAGSLFNTKDELKNEDRSTKTLQQCVLSSESLHDIEVKKLNVSESLDSIFFYSMATVDKNSFPFDSQMINKDYRREQLPPDTSKHIVSSPHTLYCSAPKDVTPIDEKPKDVGKSSEDLAKVYLHLQNELPSFFVKSQSYGIYSPDIIFENRIRGTRTEGLSAYVRQLGFLRMIGHIRFAFVKLEVLKITKHQDDLTVRVRWKIIGISAIRALPLAFTLREYTFKALKEKVGTWYDGFSIFYVGADGLIYKHVADNMIPDEERPIVKKASRASRLAALFGWSPKATIPAPTEPAVSSSVIKIPKREPEKESKALMENALL